VGDETVRMPTQVRPLRGGVLSERSIYTLEDFGDEKFCSANCADSAYAEYAKTWPPDTGD